MVSQEIREKFLKYFKKNKHVIVPSSSLIPDDPSVLLTTAGMQQFKKYYTGELDPMKDFGSKNTVSVQKSFRTSDIDEVGDESHLTFFEMLGNFSFGGYFKKEAIKYGYDFITNIMKLEIEYVTVFDPDKVRKGDWRKTVPFDEESYNLWKTIGVSEDRILREGIDNFWGPTGNEGPCGPTTEIYIRNASGKAVEVWNIVFNEFYRNSQNELKKLEIPGVDTGMGLERLTMAYQNVPTIFDTNLFKRITSLLPPNMDLRVKRILADHARGICFLIADGVRPSNKEAGYVLRRLIRRVIVHEHLAGMGLKRGMELEHVLGQVIQEYDSFYPELKKEVILPVFEAEYEKFKKTIDNGLKELQKTDSIDAKSAFKLYESFGLPYEIIKELGGAKATKLNREEFDAEFKHHQEISRAGQEKKFGGHGLLLDTGELKAADEAELKKVTRLHTATHMLQQALREVLGQEVKQAGSDITVERTRFDFSFPRKLAPEEIKKVEDRVNEKIAEDLPMQKEVMPKIEAEKTGALYFFKEKYPDPVNVYYIGKDLEHAWSKEFCGGPHVTHTGEIGKFKIVKEEAVGAGTRRIRAIVEP
jgi:alanyl-tRNA synthetase